MSLFSSFLFLSPSCCHHSPHWRTWISISHLWCQCHTSDTSLTNEKRRSLALIWIENISSKMTTFILPFFLFLTFFTHIHRYRSMSTVSLTSEERKERKLTRYVHRLIQGQAHTRTIYDEGVNARARASREKRAVFLFYGDKSVRAPVTSDVVFQQCFSRVSVQSPYEHIQCHVDISSLMTSSRFLTGMDRRTSPSSFPLHVRLQIKLTQPLAADLDNEPKTRLCKENCAHTSGHVNKSFTWRTS